MKWSWKLGRFAGIDTYVHASFLLLIGWAAWAAWSGAEPLLSVVLGVGFLLAVFGSVLLHELGHALVARRYGIATRRIVLSPIGGIAQLEGMPRKPREEMAVALAGPAVNFALAAGLWILSPIFGSGLMANLVGSLIVANLTLGLFNLVPAFPMDGGRALRAFLAERIGSQRATEIAARVGKGLALAGGLYGLFTGQWILALIAGFVWFAANSELAASRYYPSAYYDEVEVLGAPTRHDWYQADRPFARRSWINRFDTWTRGATHAPRRSVSEMWERVFRSNRRSERWATHRPPAPQPGPVRVVVIRRGF
ncbi:MAG: site-2 protease family protein [Myxococcota bacterium]